MLCTLWEAVALLSLDTRSTLALDRMAESVRLGSWKVTARLKLIKNVRDKDAAYAVTYYRTRTFLLQRTASSNIQLRRSFAVTLPRYVSRVHATGLDRQHYSTVKSIWKHAMAASPHHQT